MAAQTIRQNVEITYDYHPNKGHCREHWMYYAASGKTIEECYEKARKHFHTQMKALGWTKITTLTNVGPLRRVNDAAKKHSPSNQSDASKPSPSKPKRNKGIATGDRRKTRTSKRRVKKSSGAS